MADATFSGARVAAGAPVAANSSVGASIPELVHAAKEKGYPASAITPDNRLAERNEAEKQATTQRLSISFCST